MHSVARIASLLIVLAVASAATPPGLPLPGKLKDYPKWRASSANPFSVPYDRWVLCVGPAPKQEQKAAQDYGPHDQFRIRVYANPAASTTFFSSSVRTFDEGSIVVKEKSIAGQPGPVAVAAMVKGAKGSHPGSGDWEFVYVSSQGPVVATTSCVDCHRTAPGDFVFRTHARERT